MSQIITQAPDYVFRPARASRVAVEEFKRRADHPLHLDWGVQELDDYLIPMMPGDLVGLVTRPGHGKTTNMIYHCKRTSSKLPPGYINVYATWETLIEEFAAVYNAESSGQTLEAIGRGTANMDRLIAALAASVNDNVAIVGRSMERDSRDRVLTPKVHDIDDLERCLSSLTESGLKLGCVYVDYLQRIPGRGRGVDRTSVVHENLERLKDMALNYTCSSMVGVQASRDVDSGSGLLLPTIKDGQWASSIEQTTDKLFGMTRPILYMQPNQDILMPHLGKKYTVSPTMMAVKVLKQRWGKSGATFVLDLDPGAAVLRSVPEHMVRPMDAKGGLF